MHLYTSKLYSIYFICVVFWNGYIWSFWSIPVPICLGKGDTKCWSKFFPAIAMIVQTLLLRSVTASLQCLSCHDIAELCSQAIVYHVKRKQFVSHFAKDSLFDDTLQYLFAIFLKYIDGSRFKWNWQLCSVWKPGKLSPIAVDATAEVKTWRRRPQKLHISLKLVILVKVVKVRCNLDLFEQAFCHYNAL